MQQLTPEGQRVVNELSSKHGFGTDEKREAREACERQREGSSTVESISLGRSDRKNTSRGGRSKIAKPGSR